MYNQRKLKDYVTILKLCYKNFDHYEGRFKVDILAEMKCHAMKKEISVMFLEKMTKQLKEKETEIFALK